MRRQFVGLDFTTDSRGIVDGNQSGQFTFLSIEDGGGAVEGPDLPARQTLRAKQGRDE
jgi:hypothetical protein